MCLFLRLAPKFLRYWGLKVGPSFPEETRKCWNLIAYQKRCDFWGPGPKLSDLEASWFFWFFLRKVVQIGIGGPTQKIIEQKMCRIKRGVSGWFSNFVQTCTNSSKLEPVVVSFWKVYQKNYFFMLSNFCFMNFFDLTGHNGAIEARKTSQVSRKSPSSSVIWPRIKKCHSSKGV